MSARIEGRGGVIVTIRSQYSGKQVVLMSWDTILHCSPLVDFEGK